MGYARLLLAVALCLTAPAFAGDAAKGITCAEFSNGMNACNKNGCFVCTSGTWVEQPIYIGASSATCDASHEGLQRYNSTDKVMEFCDGTSWKSIASSVPAACTGPNAFSFTNVTDATLNTVYTSNTITPAGCAATMSVSVSGAASAQISINGGAWATSGAISAGQTIAVRLTSSGSASTTLSAVVTIGSTTGTTWTVTTRAGQLKIFRTANTYNGNLGGLSGADAVCQTEANTLGYAGTYKAVMSDESTNAKDRLTLVYPIVRASDGVTVDSVNLWDGGLNNAVAATSGHIYSGTASDGTKTTGNTCSGWTVGNSGANSLYGLGDSSSNTWISFSNTHCGVARAIYCLQQ